MKKNSDASLSFLFIKNINNKEQDFGIIRRTMNHFCLEYLVFCERFSLIEKKMKQKQKKSKKKKTTVIFFC